MSFKHYQPRNIVVTGGAGFIGANFIRYLLKNVPEVRIVNVDALTYAGSLDNLRDLPDPSRHEFVQGEIGDAALMSAILEKKNIDTIVHFAAESHVDRSIVGPAPFIHTNLLGTFTLLEAARREWLEKRRWNETECRFHHISTDEVFGSLGKCDPAFTEKTAYAPNSPYSASKAGSDHLVRAYTHTYGLGTTLSNCSNNYGPYQHAEKLIPTIIRACRNQTMIPIYGDGSNIRDWLYVEDHCAALYAILTQGKTGEAYNIGGSHEVSNLAVAHHICDVMDEMHPQKKSHRELIQFVKDRPGHDWRYAIDHTKITTSLGWRPQETFESGLRKTVAFYMGNK